MNVQPYDVLRGRIGAACDKMAYGGRWALAYDLMKHFETWWERTRQHDTTEVGDVPNIEDAPL